MFVIPVLVLTIADAGSAVIGKRYGATRYGSANKTLEGSLAFAIVALVCIYVPLAVSGVVGRIETALIASTLALAVTLIEGIARRGRDNLFIPVGTYFILGALLDLDIHGLQLWLVIAIAVAGLLVMRVGATNRPVQGHAIRAGWPLGRADVRRKRSWA
jgi:phytol kinase